MPSSEQISLGARYQLTVADARTLAELQLRIDWHKGMFWWMKYKIRLALASYLLEIATH